MTYLGQGGSILSAKVEVLQKTVEWSVVGA